MIVSAAAGGGDPAILAAINALNQHFQPGGMVHTLNQHFQPGGMVHTLNQHFQPGGMVHTLNQHFQPGGMVTNLVEELRSTNRTTAILANNNSLVLYHLLELKVSLYLEN
jgi:hypothetical protein